MNIDPQYTFNKTGNPVGVFLPIEEWNNITEQLHLDIPRGQKDVIDIRLAEYNKDPKGTLDRDTLSKESDREDEAL